MSIPPLQFEVAVRHDYHTEQVVAAPRGELDILTAGDLRRALDAATEVRTSLVVDLADLDFCDAAGLGVIVHMARRLADRGGALSLRSPSAMVAKLLDITGLQTLVAVAGNPPSAPTPALTNPQHLVGAIADSLVPLVSESLVDGTMRMVATITERLGAAVYAASVTMQRRGRLVTVAATHPVARDLDQVQYDFGSGPCVEAATYGRVVHGSCGSDTTSWPALREAAQQAGISAVLSTPFPDSSQLIGALNLYAGDRDLSEADGELASVLVSEAASVVALRPLDREELSERLSQALADRERIAHAQGIMMERHNLSAPEAYTRLIHDAAASATLLNDTAAQIIDDTTEADSSTPAGDVS